jgi:ubiquinone/menaquinone biosynthesis C-methylase UbiE
MRFIAFSGILLAFCVVGAQAQSPKSDPPKPPVYETKKIHDPYGTGKFYLGREIAQVMGFQGAGWLERPEREKEENASKLLEALEVKEGQVIVDFGAGSGYHTVKLAKLVGDKGKIHAVDIQKEMLTIMKNRFKREKITNVNLVLNSEKSMKQQGRDKWGDEVPEGKVDMILMVDVYHELSYPYEMTVELVKALKPGGQLVFVEFRLEDKKVPILDVHRMSIAQVKKEMAPFKEMSHSRTVNHLPWQHVIFFEKADPDKDKEKPKKD